MIAVTIPDALRARAKRRRVNIYINSSAIRKGDPHIEIKARGITLSAFHDADDAMGWLDAGRTVEEAK